MTGGMEGGKASVQERVNEREREKKSERKKEYTMYKARMKNSVRMCECERECVVSVNYECG
jgi:hypothetical protein